ncbi:4-hydroxybenzoyl-CoA thioesterase [Candidatus Endobugula sertula]|uniref:4-hydroxybenzoyl-CoA thioesterase n=1 Tax=Candidatus Endobugula sertula TaxID=62101 RepID=A0A1D2QPX2_9GAMM|nr:4-hydroxybenzoyl-CoA thioesterase [Candidatus Endobugula sertula]
MKHTTQTTIIIPFHDIDVMGVTWHGHYVKYFEIARCALLDSINYNYEQMKASGYIWPIIDMRIRYPQSAVFNQSITVIANIAEWEHRLKIEYQVLDAETSQRLTRGYTIQVAVDATTGAMCLESPAILLKKLGISE